MYKVDDEEETKKIFDILKKSLISFNNIGERSWGDPSGCTQELNVYEIKSKSNIVWSSVITWPNANTGEDDRSGIITTLPDYNENHTLGQTFSMCVPYYFSKRFNTRMYEDKTFIEVRNYGRFTIGRKGLKMQYFFDYLRNNKYDNEICTDEERKQYVCILKFKKYNIDPKYLSERLIKWTVIIKKYKDYYKSMQIK